METLLLSSSTEIREYVSTQLEKVQAEIESLEQKYPAQYYWGKRDILIRILAVIDTGLDPEDG